MMNIQELASLRIIKKKVKIIIMNNNGYASIRNTQNNYFQGRSIATDSSSNLNIPEFKKLANAFDFKFMSINKIEELRKITLPFVINRFTIGDTEFLINQKIAARCLLTSSLSFF